MQGFKNLLSPILFLPLVGFLDGPLTPSGSFSFSIFRFLFFVFHFVFCSVFFLCPSGFPFSPFGFFNANIESLVHFEVGTVELAESVQISVAR